MAQKRVVKVSDKKNKHTHNSQQRGAIHFQNHPCQLVRGNGFTLLTSKRVSKKAFAIMKSWKGAKVPEGNGRNAKVSRLLEIEHLERCYFECPFTLCNYDF